MFEKDGMYYIVKRFGEDDFMVCLTEDPSEDNEGCSIRGTKEGILKDFEDDEKTLIKFLMDNE